MACYHPVEAWDYTPDDYDGSDSRSLSFRGPSDFESRTKMIRQGRRLMLPCRKCVGCRLDHSREWANRVVMEQCYHDESWFLTLTYDDEHLPPAYPVDSATGEILSVHATLVKEDIQKFLKRLRKNSGQKIRYFLAGEYGSHTYRPHYHLLLFGLHLDDLQLLRQNFAGQPYYISDFISKCWPYGIHILGRVTWQSAAYVARYTMKKATHGFDRRYYAAAGIEPEFQLVSRCPGLGRQYYDDHPELFDFVTYSVVTPQGGQRMCPPEYFRKLFRDAHPVESFKRSLNSRVNTDAKIHLKLMLTDKDYYDILSDDERRIYSRLSALTRDDI